MLVTKTKGSLLIIGGAEDREGECRILKEFVKLAGGDEAEIVVMTIATDHPKEAGAEYKKIFTKLKAKKVDVVDVSKREDVHDEKALEMLKKATGIFFTGGDQLHITALVGGSQMDTLLLDRLKDNIVIGGTSAGAAMMSSAMMLGGAGDCNPRLEAVKIGPGMGFLKDSIIDTHFSQRGRHGRLLTAVAHYPHDIGIGIDENTALVVKDGHYHVIGEGSITLFDMQGTSYTNITEIHEEENLAIFDVKLHVLCSGHSFDTHTRTPYVTSMNPGEEQDPREVDTRIIEKRKRVPQPRKKSGKPPGHKLKVSEEKDV